MTIRVLHGDARTVLATLSDASVQCCVTSPPYYGLRNYGVAGQIGNEATPDAYIAEMVAAFREVRRVLRDNGTLWLNLGDAFLDKQLQMIPARVAIALQADGWWLRSDIIWAKPNPMPESVTDRPTSSHEHVFLLTKNERYFFDAEAVKEAGVIPAGTLGAKGSVERFETAGVNSRPPEYKLYDGTRNIRNVWTIATQPYSEAHFATFPPELAERCIKAGTSEKGCCAACGAPWVRVMERYDTGRIQKMTDGWDTGDGAHGTVHRTGREKGKTGVPVMASTTTGWSQSCACPPSVPVPCTVLDPFAGAFTAPMVADRLQRHAIGIELNQAYCTMARARLTKDAGMFAELAAE